MSRPAFAAVSALLLVSLPPSSFAVDWLTDPDEAAKSLRAERHADEEIERKVRMHKVQATIDKVPVRDALETWLKATFVTYRWDEEVIAAENVDLTRPLTLHLGEVTLAQALHFAFTQAELDWYAEEGRMVLTSWERTANKACTRIYPLAMIGDAPVTLSDVFGEWKSERDIFPSVDFWGGSGPWLPGRFGLGFFGGDGANGPLSRLAQFAGGNWPADIPFRATPVPRCWEDIIPALVQGSTSGQWEDVDDVGGSMQLIGRLLLVRNARQVQEEIDGLLHDLWSWPKEKSPRQSLQLSLRRGYPRDQEAAWQQALEERVSFHYKDVSLRSAIIGIAAERRLPLFIDEEALRDDGIKLDKSIDWRVENQILRKALEERFDPPKIDAILIEGALVITPMVIAEEALATRMYDLHGIIAAERPHELVAGMTEATSGQWEEVDGVGGTVALATPKVIIVRQTRHAHGEVAAYLDQLRELGPNVNGAQPLPAALLIRQYPLHNASRAEDLVRLVPQFVAPKSWTDEDDGPKIERLGEQLVIRQSRGVHALIAQFLKTVDPPVAKAKGDEPD